jgi:pyrroline-5-carboxylate reductase
MTTFGVIGTGSMGSMLIRKMVESGQADAHAVVAFNRSEGKARAIADETGIRIVASARDVAEQSEIVFLCVRPLEVQDVLEDLRGVLTPDKLLVSVASDVALNDLSAWSEARTAKVIPSITSACGGGVSLIAFGDTASASDRELVLSLFGAMSAPVEIEEGHFEVMTALTSCAPAFIAAMMQEFGAAAVRREGISPALAEQLVRETLIGTTRLLAESGADFEGLISRVATEGGITREGVDIIRQRMPRVFDEVFEKTHAKHERVKQRIRDQDAG